MAKRMPLVHVTWVDSCSPGRKWQDPSEIKGYTVSTCESVGWLMEKNSSSHVIAATLGSYQVGDVTAIPNSCVKKIRRLR